MDANSRCPAGAEESQLLHLPTELRLQICSYMTIAPAKIDWEWKGAFFTCRKLQQDMLNKLSPASEVKKFFQTEVMLSLDIERAFGVTPGLPHPFFGWVRSVTVHFPLYREWFDVMYQSYPLYSLYLDELQILLTGGPGQRKRFLPWGDLKSTAPTYLMDESKNRKLVMNCKKITVTLDDLITVDGGRDKETSFGVTIPGTDLTYLFTIVQDRNEEQVQRSYTFKNRFKLPIGEKEKSSLVE
ncbi:hypothetical protein E8E13_007409 [Curvularia kusanoi]|uniref:Uncharacterized protein n=1 Tax=Curvularia kusanoi TaxID=90978 RepID=A0A9P4WAS1_CURKU|nr:hypothetical protein E8E13_007409 [Curvularia kusanoi]